MKEKAQKAPVWRKWLRRGFLLVLIVTTCTLIWMQQEKRADVQPTPSPSPSIAPQPDERTLREAAYDKDLAALQKLVESTAADDQTQAQAARRMDSMIAEHQSEIAIEEALSRAGFLPVLVLCQNGALTVMVEQELSAEASASVLSLCMAYVDIAAENIRIMTVQP